MAAFGFGNHLAFHVSRIREVYFNSGLPIPQNLLVFPTAETMAEFLHALSRALLEEHSMLYFEGCQGVGHILAIVMALCPEDTMVTIENEIVSQGQRRSVVIAIQSETPSQFSVESILYDGGARSNAHIVSVEVGRKLSLSPISLKWDGCLSDALDLALINVGARSTVALRISCVELISAIIFSVSGGDLHAGPVGRLPENGFRALLGSNAVSRVRDTLQHTFNCEPSATHMRCDEAYNDLLVKIADVVPSSACRCNRSFGDGCFTDPWKVRFRDCRKCRVAELWGVLDGIVTRGIVASFVTAEENTCIRLSIDDRADYRLGGRLLRCISKLPNGQGCSFGIVELHAYILGLNSKFKTGQGGRRLGVSSGACSIFPATIQNPLFQSPQELTYVLADGQFHDEHNSYQLVTSDKCSGRRIAVNSITGPPVVPSNLGAISSLTMSARGVRDQLTIRTMIQMSTKTLSVDFYEQHLAYMGVNIATTCGHNTRNPLSRSPVAIITTSVAAPAVFEMPRLPWDDKRSRGQIRNDTQPALGMALTHQSPESQFLACVPRTPTLFQGDSCLDCAVEQAHAAGFELVIQS